MICVRSKRVSISESAAGARPGNGSGFATQPAPSVRVTAEAVKYDFLSDYEWISFRPVRLII